MNDSQPFPKAAPLRVGDTVRIDLEAYRAWYEEQNPAFVFPAAEGANKATITQIWEDGYVAISASDWGAFAVPPQFVEKI